MKKSELNDHDLLIRVDTKVDNLAADIKDLKDGVTAKIVNIEAKVIGYDKIIAEIDPLTIKQDVEFLKQQVHDFHTTAMVYRTLAGIIGGIVVFVLIQAPIWLKELIIFK